MRVGLVGRSDARGLGHISREFFRFVRPERTLIVEPKPSRLPSHREWYPADGRRVAYVGWSAEQPRFPDGPLSGWLDGLDVVYGAETFYDPRFVDIARSAGVATVLHVNPEFYRAGVSDQATVVWNQSPWLHNRLRHDAEVMPVPVATDRFEVAPPNTDGPLRVLHVAGNVAGNDRNGSAAAYAAVSRCRGVEFTAVSQRRVEGVRTKQASGDYWEMYQGFDVLVMPRRYAGQCLPVQEAMAAGLAVIMPDCPPNDWWSPVIRVPATAGQPIDTPGGKVPTHDVDVAALAAAVQRLADDRSALVAARAAGLAWAEENSWSELLPRYEAALADASLPKVSR